MKDSRLRIAMFSDSALPVVNGVSISLDLLIKQLRSRGHSVHLFTASHFRHRDSDPNTHRFRAVETPWTRNYPLAFPPFTSKLREFRRHTFDIIHTHTPFTIGFVGMRWAESHGVPIVSTYHTLYDKYAHYIPIFPKRYVRYKIAKHTNFYYNSVHHVITPSEAAKRWLKRHSVHVPITVIPTGIEKPIVEGRAEARQRLGLHPAEKVLLYVGRIAREKNMTVLLQSAARVMQRLPISRLIIVGDGPSRAECAEQVRSLGIGDAVQFTGYLDRRQVQPYYEAADVFVFASQTETQGLVVGEAMSHGLPSVVVQGGGAGDAVLDGVNGYIVRNDADVFANQVVQLLNDESLYCKISSGALQSSRELSCDVMTQRVEAVYLSVLGAPSATTMGSRIAVY